MPVPRIHVEKSYKAEEISSSVICNPLVFILQNDE